MFDNNTMVLSIEGTPFTKAFSDNLPPSIEYSGLEFGLNLSKINFPRYICMLNGLYLEANYYGIRCINSIHKYAHGYNHTDFTLSQFEDTIGHLSDRTSLDWGSAEIKKLEMGCNLVEPASLEIFGGLISYRRKFFFPMKEGLEKGVKLDSTNFDLKCYNKYAEAHARFNVPKDLSRAEYCAKRMKKEHPNIRFVSDLYEIQNTERLIERMMDRFRKVKVIDSIDLSKLTAKELRTVALYSNPTYSVAMKKYHPYTFKKDVALYNMIAKSQGKGVVSDFFDKVENKSFELLNS